jgi:membrane-associated phospholipid phosphatase
VARSGDVTGWRGDASRRWLEFIERPRVRTLRTRYARQIAFVLARLSPKAFLGLHLTIGVLVLAIATWTFGAIAEDVARNDAIVRLDIAAATWLHLHAAPSTIALLMVVTNLHNPLGVSLMAAALAAFLAARKHYYWLLALVVALPGGMLVNDLVKHVFHRARPQFDDPFLLLQTYSFPSGHVAGSTLFYGFIVAFVMNRLPKQGSRTGIVVVAVLMVALVAVSRMILGAHYLSDVLGAFCEALAWLAIALTGVHAFRQARERRGLLG